VKNERPSFSSIKKDQEDAAPVVTAVEEGVDSALMSHGGKRDSKVMYESSSEEELFGDLGKERVVKRKAGNSTTATTTTTASAAENKRKKPKVSSATTTTTSTTSSKARATPARKCVSRVRKPSLTTSEEEEEEEDSGEDTEEDFVPVRSGKNRSKARSNPKKKTKAAVVSRPRKRRLPSEDEEEDEEEEEEEEEEDEEEEEVITKVKPRRAMTPSSLAKNSGSNGIGAGLGLDELPWSADEMSALRTAVQVSPYHIMINVKPYNKQRILIPMFMGCDMMGWWSVWQVRVSPTEPRYWAKVASFVNQVGHQGRTADSCSKQWFRAMEGGETEKKKSTKKPARKEKARKVRVSSRCREKGEGEGRGGVTYPYCRHPSLL